jgi:transcriptional regulator with XRE-family HTH domain
MNFREARIAAGYGGTQGAKRLAQVCRCSVSTIYRFNAGETPTNTMKYRLARALNCSVLVLCQTRYGGGVVEKTLHGSTRLRLRKKTSAKPSNKSRGQKGNAS